MTDELPSEMKEAIDKMSAAERAFLLSVITGEGYDEAFAALEKEKNENN